QFETSCTRPASSSGMPAFVDSPMPNLCKYSYLVSGDRLLPSIEMPTFDEYTSVPVSVQCFSSCCRASLNETPSSGCHAYGTVTVELGVAFPSSISAAAVIALNVEPGSYGYVN